MPAQLVRPYVRVIPIQQIPPAAYPRRSTVPPVPPRSVPQTYRAKHAVVVVADVRPPTRRRTRRRRHYPALAWGALLVTLTATALSLRPGEQPVVTGQLVAAQTGRLQVALVPAPAGPEQDPARAAQARLAQRRAALRADAPVRPAAP